MREPLTSINLSCKSIVTTDPYPPPSTSSSGQRRISNQNGKSAFFFSICVQRISYSSGWRASAVVHRKGLPCQKNNIPIRIHQKVVVVFACGKTMNNQRVTCQTCRKISGCAQQCCEMLYKNAHKEKKKEKKKVEQPNEQTNKHRPYELDTVTYAQNQHSS